MSRDAPGIQWKEEAAHADPLMWHHVPLMAGRFVAILKR